MEYIAPLAAWIFGAALTMIIVHPQWQRDLVAWVMALMIWPLGLMAFVSWKLADWACAKLHGRDERDDGPGHSQK